MLWEIHISIYNFGSEFIYKEKERKSTRYFSSATHFEFYFCQPSKDRRPSIIIPRISEAAAINIMTMKCVWYGPHGVIQTSVRRWPSMTDRLSMQIISKWDWVISIIYYSSSLLTMSSFIWSFALSFKRTYLSAAQSIYTQRKKVQVQVDFCVVETCCVVDDDGDENKLNQEDAQLTGVCSPGWL